MSTLPQSRWAQDDAETGAESQRRRREKENKKRLKTEKQSRSQGLIQQPVSTADSLSSSNREAQCLERPIKRRRLSNESTAADNFPGSKHQPPARVLEFAAPEWGPCRHVNNFESLNPIEEGAYGLVSRARESTTGDIVAIKKLKMENSYEGFPVTGLREIQTLSEARHPHIVRLREVVMGDTMDDVFLVMDFIEHDLKTLLDDMRDPFLPSETKTLLLQVIGAAEFLHSHWIMHRDLKTSNLLMNNRGEIKLADFGMARYYGDPAPKLTQLVVTLWYRAPELLLGANKYGTEIDIWSIGCIFGELLTKVPLLRGKNEVEQLSEVGNHFYYIIISFVSQKEREGKRELTKSIFTQIFALTGPPTTDTWPEFRSLPNAKFLRLPTSSTSHSRSRSSGPTVPLLPRKRFPYLTPAGLSLLSNLLALNPASRPTARACLSHPYFREDPKPKAKEMFPTFPSKAGLERRRRRDTPEAPKRGEEAPRLDFASIFGRAESGARGQGGAGVAIRLG
ncbi:hypothetical protein FQN57_007080 [Myotisia sp. PD_48]|nr:hypothetical protein FQN57_007080 [Myotisia sp. PD_48]